ncbi:hypothetical protein DFQ27_009636 [Actinomortierella ambigua]|uniref:CCHC-type domain-containing protein n=1 Tax=Actinomortierella ambigua TaxID=1343610 RepID=A0A9P6PQ21_9FUNG|nr:hypothetical protein DFQ27_009636 [Actinomortierella ambigua]
MSLPADPSNPIVPTTAEGVDNAMLVDQKAATPQAVDPLLHLQSRLMEWQEQHASIILELSAITVRLDIPETTPSADDLTTKEELTKKEDFLRNKVDEYVRLRDRLLAARKPMIDDKAKSNPEEAKSSTATLDPAIPRFGKERVHYSLPKGASLLSSPLEFLEKFATQVRSMHGEKNMERLCARLLILAMMDDDQQGRVSRALAELPETDRTWRRCEQLFVETLLTPNDMEQQAKIAIARGRPSNESYQRYAWTLERLVRIYKVDESPSRVVLLDYMKATIPSHVLDTMTLLYVMDVRSNLVKVADPSKALAIDSAHLFISYLEKMHGPDDCEDRKRLLATLDELGAKDRSSKRARASGPHLRWCDNGCGANSTHDTNGCITCGLCKHRGHIAKDCKQGAPKHQSAERKPLPPVRQEASARNHRRPWLNKRQYKVPAHRID